MKAYLINRIAELRKMSHEDGHLQYTFRIREAQRALDRLNEMEADTRLVADDAPQLKARIEGLNKTILFMENELFAKDTELAELRTAAQSLNDENRKMLESLEHKGRIVSSTAVILHRNRDGVIVHSEEVNATQPQVKRVAEQAPMPTGFNPYTGL